MVFFEWGHSRKCVCIVVVRKFRHW
jgi:hypothetical protein